MTDQHPTARGVPPAKNWARRLASAAAGVLLLAGFSGGALAQGWADDFAPANFVAGTQTFGCGSSSVSPPVNPGDALTLSAANGCADSAAGYDYIPAGLPRGYRITVNYTLTLNGTSAIAAVGRVGQGLLSTGTAGSGMWEFVLNGAERPSFFLGKSSGFGTPSVQYSGLTYLSGPLAPTAVSATHDDPNNEIDITWTAPVDFGDAGAVDSYVVTAQPGNLQVCSVLSPVTSCSAGSLQGLVGGTAYTFTVVSTSVNGNSRPSDVSNAATLSTPPATPAAPTGTAGQAQVLLNWVAPANGGAAITGYNVTYSTNGTDFFDPEGSCASASTTVSTSTTCTATNLVNGQSYVFQVRAINGEGPSAFSPSSAPVVPAGAPAAPAAPTFTSRASGSLSITWAAPNNGGSAITGYTVQRSLEAPISWEAAGGGCSGSVTGTSCTDATLTPGARYVFRVSAQNAIDSSGFSPSSDSEMAAREPGAPAAPTLSRAGSGALTLNWAYPADDGGSPVIEYELRQFPENISVCNSPDGNPPATTCTVTGLTNGQPYSFIIAARNVPGWGPFSEQSLELAPGTLPDAPSIDSLTALNRAIRVDWTPPANTGGLPILDYTVTASPLPSGADVVQVCSASQNFCTVTGLDNGVDYSFVLSARNEVGSGAASAAFGPEAPEFATSSINILGRAAPAPTASARTNEPFTIQYEVLGDVLAPASNSVRIEARTAADATVAQCVGDITAATVGRATGSCTFAAGLKPSDGVVRLQGFFLGTPEVAASDTVTAGGFGFSLLRSNTTTTLTTGSPTVFGQDVTLTGTFAAVSPGAGPVTGTARFVRLPSNTTIAEVAVAGGSASTTIPSPGVGTFRYAVALVTNDDFNGSNNAQDHVVNRAATSTSVSLVTPTPVVLSPTAFTAAVAVTSPGAGTPTGTVRISRVGAPAEFCEFTLGAQTGCSITFQTKEDDARVTAEYLGDSNFAGSTVDSSLFDISGLASTLSLSPPATAPYYGSSFAVGYTLGGGDGQFDGAVTLTAEGPNPATTTFTASCSPTAPNGSTGTCVFAGPALPLPAGDYSLTASYAGDPTDIGDGATSATSIQPATTALSVSTSPNPSAAGAPVTLSVELAIDNGAGSLSGTLSVSAPGMDASACTLSPTAAASPYTASCQVSFANFGPGQTVTAEFVPSDTANYLGDTATTTHEVTAAPTDITIGMISPASPQVGDSLVVPFTVTGGLGALEGGIAARLDGNLVPCTALTFETSGAQRGEGSCTLGANLFQSAGNYSVRIEFTPDPGSNDGASFDQVVANVFKRDTTATLSASPASPSQAGTSVQFTVSVAPAGGSFQPGTAADGTAYVCVSPGACDAGTNVCAVSLAETAAGAASGQCSFAFEDVTSRTLVAVYAGNDDFNGDSSDTQTYVTERADTTTAITGLSPATTLVGQPLTISFDVDGGAGTITGAVSVLATRSGGGTATCGPVSVAADGTGSCTFRVADGSGLIQAGSWSFVADFTADPAGNEADSDSSGNPATTRNVTQASTSLVLSSAPRPSVYNQPFTLTATVTAAAPSEGYPTGNVEFQDADSNTIGVVALTPTAVPGVSIAEVTGLVRPVGNFPFSAFTVTNPNFSGANSFEFTHPVVAADQTISFAQPPAVDFSVGGSFTVSASADSNVDGLLVSFSSSTPSVCTVAAPGTSPATVNIVSGGDCVLTATQGGNTNWNPAEPVQRTVTINRIAQFITFGSLPIRPAGAAPFTVSATSDSGLPVSFSSLTPATCTVSGNLVSYVAPGVCEIAADQAGNASYNPAVQEVRDFVYIAIEIEGDAVDGTVDESYFVSFNATSDGSANPPFAYVLTGDAVPGVTLNATTGALSGVPTTAGTYTFTITATDSSVAGPDRIGAPYSGSRELTIEIAKADQTINVTAPASVPYAPAAATFNVSAVATSALPVSVASTTTDVCTATGTSTAGSDVAVTIVSGGDCVLRFSQAGNDDWNAAPDVLTTVEITRIPQAITFAPLPNRAAPSDDFPLSASSDSGLAVSFASTTPAVCTLTGNSVVYVAPGVCSITASQAGNASYEPATDVTRSFSYVAITVSPETLPAGTRNAAYSQQITASGIGASPPFTFAVTAGSLPPGLSLGSNGALSGTPTSAGDFNFTVTATDASDVPNLNAPYSGQRSYTLSIAKNPQAITGFAATPNALVYLGSPATLSATGGASGEPVVFSSLTPTICSVSGNQVSPLLAGTCTVAADQDGTDDYEPAPRVTLDITVAKATQAPLVVSATPATVRYDETGELSTTGGTTGGLVNYAVTTGASFCEIDQSRLPVLVIARAAGGTCTITATMDGNDNYEPVSGTVVVTTVQAPQENFELVADPSTIAFNGTSTLTTLGGSGTGAVTLAITGQNPGPGVGPTVCTLAGSTLTAVGVGTCTVEATKAADSNYLVAVSSVEIEVVKADQTLSFALPAPGPLTIGGPVASVLATATSGLTPIYGVAAGSESICDVNPSNGGLTLLSAGTCVLTANQPGDAFYNAAAQVTQSVVIEQAQPGIALVSSGSPTSPGDAVTFTATVSAGFNPTGTVTFQNNGVNIAGCVDVALTGLTAQCVTSALPQGSHPITATYNGDLNNLTATSNTVTQVVLTGTTITLNPGNLTEARFGQLVSVGFTVSGGVAPNEGMVTVTATRPGSTRSCTVAASAGACTLDGLVTTGPLLADGYTVSASYGGDGDDGASTTAATQRLNVIRSNTNTDLVFAPVTSAPFNQSFTLTATLSSVAPGAGTPTGTVVFFRNGQSVAEVGLNGSGVATYTVPAGLAVGSYTFTAQYGGDTNFLPSFTDRPYAVTAKATTTTITGSSVNPSALGASVNFTYSVATSPTDTTPTGTVTLTASTGETCSASVSTGNCSLTFNTAGARTVTAVYGGDALHATSTSVAFAHSVNKGTQAALSATATPNAILFGGTSALATTGGTGTGAVSFAVTTGGSVCSISGSTLTGTGVGTCTVTATKAGDANYEPTSATVDVTVSRAPQAALVVTATPDSIVFQGTSTLATTGGTGTGAVSYAVTGGTGTCSLSGSTLTGTGVGTCVVTATKAGGDNYLDQTGTVTVTVTQAPQIITFGTNPGPLTFGGTSGSVSATASSGLPVSFSTASSTVCSVDAVSGAITILGAGNCVVAANQAGNANYLAAPEVTQTVVINKAQQAAIEVTATPQTIVFQSTSALAATGGSGTGTAITYAVTGGTGTCTISGSTLTGTGVGTCVVTATKAGDANYEQQTGTVTVTVNKASQTISFGANPGPLTFGGTSGTVSATASSGLPVSFGTSTPAVCSVKASSGLITVITAGNCVVTADQAGNANYEAAPQVTQTVVINPGNQAALVVTATPNPVIAGQTSVLSTTGGSGTGAVTYAVTAGAASCTVAGSTLTAVAQGSCTVTATKAGDGNYLPQTGTVVVTVNPATVDLFIVKTGRYIPNGVVWTLNVANAGPGVANGATVIDNLPASVTGATWTCTGASGGSCSAASGSGSINSPVNLPVGGSVVFTITATLVDPNAATVVNTASVVAPMGITDTFEANNTSTLDLTVALFGNGFEGSGTGFGSFEAKASLSTLQIDGAAVEQQLRGIEPQDVGVYQVSGSELRIQAREINGLVEVRLIQREAKGLWSTTRWMELWPGDSVRLDYSKTGNALQTRLAVGM